jgi:GT2 family glycosyltransferase
VNYSISCSIVLYNNNVADIKKTIRCILESNLKIKLFLIDNSETDKLRNIVTDYEVEYIFNGENVGYGPGHNIAVRKSLQIGVKYHLVMNPDITFGAGTLDAIYDYMEHSADVGSLMPKVHYADGSIQQLCKLLPTPFDLLGRRFFSNSAWARKRNKRYELHDFEYDHILNTPCLSGCFMFLRTSILEKSGLFDPRYFMYLEDYDLNRRINRYAKTIFFPDATIIHGHAKESYKNGKLLKIHIKSAIKYFNKWGWFIDKDRSRLNNKVLESIENTKRN